MSLMKLILTNNVLSSHNSVCFFIYDSQITSCSVFLSTARAKRGFSATDCTRMIDAMVVPFNDDTVPCIYFLSTLRATSEASLSRREQTSW